MKLLISFVFFALSVSVHAVNMDMNRTSITECFVNFQRSTQAGFNVESIPFEEDITREKQANRDGYSVVYHGQAVDGILLYELIKLLEGSNERTHYFRSSQDLSAVDQNVTAEDFITSPGFTKTVYDGQKFGSSDMRPYVRNRVLSVSLTLADHAGAESASHFLRQPKSVLSDNAFGFTGFASRERVEKIISDIVSSYAHLYKEDLNKQQIIEMYGEALKFSTAIAQYGITINRRHILRIKRDVLEHVLYLSTPGGFDVIAKNHQTLLNALISNAYNGVFTLLPQNLTDELQQFSTLDGRQLIKGFWNNPQARLIVSHPLLDNPENFVLEYKTFFSVRGKEAPRDFCPTINGTKYSVDDLVAMLMTNIKHYLDSMRK